DPGPDAVIVARDRRSKKRAGNATGHAAFDAMTLDRVLAIMKRGVHRSIEGVLLRRGGRGQACRPQYCPHDKTRSSTGNLHHLNHLPRNCERSRLTYQGLSL